MNRKMPGRAALAVLVAVTLTATAFAGKRLDGIPLVWKPTERKGVGVVNLTGLTGVKIQIEPFVDTRADRAKFGENQEDKVPRPVTTSGSVAEFCTQNFGNTLKQYGLSVVAEGGDVVVAGEILEFMVIESNAYKGEVRLIITVKRHDKTEWTGVVSGTSSRWGRSYRAENYYETISDSLLEAASNAARDESFRKALAAN
jgi:uncharacterized protein (DUF2147 family)